MCTAEVLVTVIAVYLAVPVATIDPCGLQKLFVEAADASARANHSDRNLKVATFFQQQRCDVRVGVST